MQYFQLFSYRPTASFVVEQNTWTNLKLRYEPFGDMENVRTVTPANTTYLLIAHNPWFFRYVFQPSKELSDTDYSILENTFDGL